MTLEERKTQLAALNAEVVVVDKERDRLERAIVVLVNYREVDDN